MAEITTRMPSYFIPHGGGPCFFMDWDPPDTWSSLAEFLRGIAAHLPARPKAILMVSAHWQTQGFAVGSAAHPEMIYDYYGFPPHTYELKYPAPGDPALAARVKHLLTAAGLPAYEDPERGFDHGVFIPLLLMFPQADIPVVTLSLDVNASAATLLAAGHALISLREENVLIVGSGMSFHNMRGFRGSQYQPAADAFDHWLTEAAENNDVKARDETLAQWPSAPHARDCHPEGGEEHLLPLLLAAGAAGADHGKSVFNGQVEDKKISGFRFG